MKFILFLISALIGIAKEVAGYCLVFVIFIFIAKLICDIDAQEHYSWLSGIWHGVFVVPNYICSVFNPNVLYKALNYTFMYNLLWWITFIFQIPSILYILYDAIVKPIIYSFIMATQLNDEV